jgi:hypothetical protein
MESKKSGGERRGIMSDRQFDVNHSFGIVFIDKSKDRMFTSESER